MTEGSGLPGLGWTAELGEEMETYAAVGLVPGRVVAEHRAGYVVRDGESDLLCNARGKIHDAAAVGGLLPAVGDWVAFRPLGPGRGVVEAVLTRRTAISRQEAFKGSGEQVLAANVDVVLLVMGLDRDYSVRRLERYLTTAWDSGASPAVVLTKLDLCHDLTVVVEAESVAMGAPVAAVSNVTGEGLEAIDALLPAGRTVVLLGSSGVGKTTLINRLLGDDRLATGSLRADGRGRHTTRHRELFALPGGALLIDTPGLRELQLWQGDVDEAFADVVELAAGCRFSDCRHDTEPGCAVRTAIANGMLDPERLKAYFKLQRELAAIARRRDRRLWAENKRRWRQRARESRRARRY
ncbi:MAG TPA: ribosome small subunit-dependent GTPase A [Gaiellaceae bacterium]|nr:ribosome small subunit-dependent GTPase A [Gaiellaceae bacterium]